MPRSNILLAGCAVLLLCLLPFLAGVHGPFFLDDEANLLRARAPTGQVADVLDAAVRNSSGPLRRPVSNLSFLANYHWIGATPFHYKIVNLTVHLLNGMLVWALAWALLRLLAPSLGRRAAAGIALSTAAAWMIHPLHVSTVLYAVQRMAQLSALLLFAALLLAVDTLQRLRPPSRLGTTGALSRLAATYALVLLAVLSKENGALFPLYLGAIALCAPEARRSEWTHSPPARWFLGLGVIVPLVTGAAALAWMLPGIATRYAMRDFTLAERLLTEPVVLGHYLLTILVPDIRRMGLYLDDFALRTASDPVAWVGIAAVMALLTLALAFRNRAPMACMAVLWFSAGHAMESTVLPLEIAFEHRNYAAMVGPILAVAYYGHRLFLRLPARQIALLACLPILVMAGLTARRAHQWSSIELFVTHEVANHPRSPRALTHAAAGEIARGDIASAVQHIRAAQERTPDSFWTRSYDLHLACEGVSLEIDWTQLLDQAKARPHEMGIEEALRLVVSRVIAGTCPAIPARRVDRFIEELLVSGALVARPDVMERLNILRYHVAIDEKDSARAKRSLEAAMAANPVGLEALTLAAYASLNEGDLEGARRYADMLESRISSHHPSSRLYVVHELRGYIAKEAGAKP